MAKRVHISWYTLQHVSCCKIMNKRPMFDLSTDCECTISNDYDCNVSNDSNWKWRINTWLVAQIQGLLKWPLMIDEGLTSIALILAAGDAYHGCWISCTVVLDVIYQPDVKNSGNSMFGTSHLTFINWHLNILIWLWIKGTEISCRMVLYRAKSFTVKYMSRQWWTNIYINTKAYWYACNAKVWPTDLHTCVNILCHHWVM